MSVLCAAMVACLFACKRTPPGTSGTKAESKPAFAGESGNGQRASTTAAELSQQAPPAVELADPGPSAPLEVLSITTGGGSQEERLPWVVAIHGLGDSPGGLSRLFARLTLRAHVYLPRGPHQRARGYDWFGVRVRGDERALAQAVSAAAERLSRTIEVLSRDSQNLGKPVVTGFSQGGILSFALATLHPEQLSASLPIAGWLPPPLWPETKPSAAIPIIAFHGQADRVVPYAPTQVAVRRLEQLGVDVSLQSFPGLGHSVNAELNQAWHQALEQRLALVTF